jgi:hypothetical protein
MLFESLIVWILAPPGHRQHQQPHAAVVVSALLLLPYFANVANDRLVEQFGSTRRKRQLTAKENAVVRADAVGGAEALKDMLRSAADKAAESNMTKDEIIKQTQALRAIPPHHPEAVKPHDAYR